MISLCYHVMSKCNGPWWMDEQENEERKHDVFVTTNNKNERFKTKTQLITDLKIRNVSLRTYDASKWKVVDLQRHAMLQLPPIPIKTCTNQKVITGWVGKLKGLLQVLWERGWVDDTQLHMYNM